jgi:hypothetical protein
MWKVKPSFHNFKEVFILVAARMTHTAQDPVLSTEHDEKEPQETKPDFLSLGH